MKTSLTETQKIENYLLQRYSEDAPVFEAQLILQPELREKVLWQQNTYSLIHEYSRRKLLNELELIHQKLFSDPKQENFRQKILRIFSKR